MARPTLELDPGKVAALRLLLQAHDDAEDVGREIWQFALDLPTLRQATATISDLRWLVCRRYIVHSAGVNRPASRAQCAGDEALAFDIASRFVLSAAGATFLEVNGRTSAAEMVGARPAEARRDAPRIIWNKLARELWVGDQLEMRYRREAPAQWAILDRFQRRHFVDRSIANPLGLGNGRDPGQRLREVVDDLNHRRLAGRITFHSDRQGDRVRLSVEDAG